MYAKYFGGKKFKLYVLYHMVLIPFTLEIACTQKCQLKMRCFAIGYQYVKSLFTIYPKKYYLLNLFDLCFSLFENMIIYDDD